MDCPLEYTSTHAKRQILLFMATNAEFFSKYLHRYIFYNYNNPMQKKNLSIKGYLKYMLEKDSWGDEAILYAASIMWDLSISILFPKTLRTYNLRHSINNLGKVDLVVVNTGGMHYTAVGELRVVYAYIRVVKT